MVTAKSTIRALVSSSICALAATSLTALPQVDSAKATQPGQDRALISIAMTKKWMVPRIRFASIVGTGTNILLEVTVRSSKKLRNRPSSFIEVSGGGARCVIARAGGVGRCSLILDGQSQQLSIRARAHINGKARQWSTPRRFRLDSSDPQPTPAPPPPAEATGFIGLQVIGPPLTCETGAGSDGLRIPIASTGPTALPAFLTRITTRLEVTPGTYSITPSEFTCEGVRFVPINSIITLEVRQFTTGYAFLAYSAVSTPVAPPLPAPGPAPAPPETDNSVSAMLHSLTVEKEIRLGYDRDLFRHWLDADSDGCDTREEVLIQESLSPVTTSSGCQIVSGRWLSVYDNEETMDPSTLDVDHMIPLAEAWDSGAHSWDSATREAFANDLGFAGSLIAVSASSNRSKGDRDPAEWTPPNANFLCTYVFTWISVKYRWSLSIDVTEKIALERSVDSCGNPDFDPPPRAVIATTPQAWSSNKAIPVSGSALPQR